MQGECEPRLARPPVSAAVLLGLAAETARPAPVRPPRDSAKPPSEVERPGGAFTQQAGAADVAAHGAQVAVPCVAHDVLVANAFVVGLGDEADAQRMRAQTIKPVDAEPGHIDALCQDSPNRIGMQRAGTDAI